MFISKVTAFAAVLTLGLASSAMAQNAGNGAGGAHANQSGNEYTGATGASSRSNGTGWWGSNASGGDQDTAPNSSNQNPGQYGPMGTQH